MVRKTGGLKDTVFDVDHDAERAAAVGYEPNGFNFDGTDQGALDYALNRCASLKPLHGRLLLFPGVCRCWATLARVC